MKRLSTNIAIVVAMTIGSGVAFANRGGGDSGDSSMNPITGDSYAYFHGGHNLGEQGTIRPNRVTPRRDAARQAQAPNATSPKAAAAPPDANANETTRRSATR